MTRILQGRTDLGKCRPVAGAHADSRILILPEHHGHHAAGGHISLQNRKIRFKRSHYAIAVKDHNLISLLFIDQERISADFPHRRLHRIGIAPLGLVFSVHIGNAVGTVLDKSAPEFQIHGTGNVLGGIRICHSVTGIGVAAAENVVSGRSSYCKNRNDRIDNPFPPGNLSDSLRGILDP